MYMKFWLGNDRFDTSSISVDLTYQAPRAKFMDYNNYKQVKFFFRTILGHIDSETMIHHFVVSSLIVMTQLTLS